MSVHCLGRTEVLGNQPNVLYDVLLSSHYIDYIADRYSCLFQTLIFAIVYIRLAALDDYALYVSHHANSSVTLHGFLIWLAAFSIVFLGMGNILSMD